MDNYISSNFPIIWHWQRFGYLPVIFSAFFILLWRLWSFFEQYSSTALSAFWEHSILERLSLIPRHFGRLYANKFLKTKQLHEERKFPWEGNGGVRFRSFLKHLTEPPGQNNFLYHWKNKSALQVIFYHLSIYVCDHRDLHCLSLRRCLNSRAEFKEVLSASSEKVTSYSDLLLDLPRTAPQLQSI